MREREVPRDSAFGKMKAMVNGARVVRAEIGGEGVSEAVNGETPFLAPDKCQQRFGSICGQICGPIVPPCISPLRVQS